jgi:5-hydroxyisourate hydrolase
MKTEQHDNSKIPVSQITTHILDTSRGKPAAGVAVSLHQQQGDRWLQLTSDRTNQDGRIGDWLGDRVLHQGTYKLVFLVQSYYQSMEQESFYPTIEIAFSIAGDGQHYHVPLLLNPYGYSTYRGS